MTNTFWEAVKLSLWDFQPHTVDASELEASDGTPGTREKLDVLAEHIRRDAIRWPQADRYDTETRIGARPGKAEL